MTRPRLTDHPGPTRPPRTHARRLTTTMPVDYRYLLHLPRDYRARAGRRWPVVFFFHGRGERGNDLALVRRHGPPRLAAEGRAFPFVLVAPQCPDTEWWNYAALEAFVAALVPRLRVDPARVYLTGLSMGGFATWALTQRHPERYAAILPICGGGDVHHAPALRRIPIWAFHGARDTAVPLRRTTELVAAIKAAGGRPRLTIYRSAGHDSWTETYANSAIYRWLLRHRIKATARA